MQVLADRELDSILTALADPTRRAIVARLTRGEAGVLELAAPFAISQPAVTRHLQVLERAGLVSRHRDGRRRPCRLEPQRLRQLSEWIGGYRRFWEESFERLDDYLDHLQTEGDTP
ncbi:MAG: ArsR/SmtB family transcription factor [Kineosporiaceae bacterium]